MLPRDLGVKAVLMLVKNTFHFTPFTGFVISFFFFSFSRFGLQAFSAACPVLLLTFETSVRLSWLIETSPFNSMPT